MDTIIQNLNSETTGFIIVILLFTLIFHIKYTDATAYKAPAFLTTLGIFGTFVGIAVGLLHFNANDVQKSVPDLIDGIKTAVWASACGIGCALTVKLRDIVGVKKRITAHGATGATVDDLAAILTAVQQALVGGDDSTLLSQMKLARQDSNDRLDKLNISMNEFCEKMAENNSKALIEALEAVMRDFNAKINEQFGENFKQLNQAVEKILVWQEKYREQMSEMIKQQQETTNAMSVAGDRYQTIVGQAEAFNTVAQNMSNILEGLETQRTQLNDSLEKLASLINTASTGLPEIENKIVEMTKQISDGVKTTNDEFRTVLLNVISQSNQEFNDNIKQIIEKTKEQVVVLDKALSEELTKSLESLSRQLAAVSEKFAQDYTPITERLQSVLRIAS